MSATISAPAAASVPPPPLRQRIFDEANSAHCDGLAALVEEAHGDVTVVGWLNPAHDKDSALHVVARGQGKLQAVALQAVKILTAPLGPEGNYIDVNKQNKHGNTALMEAVVNQKMEIVKVRPLPLSLSPSLPLSLSPHCRCPPILHTPQRPLRPSRPTQELMLVTDLDKVNKDGDSFSTLLVRAGHVGSMWTLVHASMTWPSPLFYACQTVNLAVVSRLVKGGVDLNQEDAWRTNNVMSVATPLAWASSRGLAPLVRILLSSPSIDPNRVDAKGATALIIASLRDHADVVQALAEHQLIDLTHGDAAGNTALHSACSLGAVRATEVLLACEGICVNQGNNKGQVRISSSPPLSLPSPSLPPSLSFSPATLASASNTPHTPHAPPHDHRPLCISPPTRTDPRC